MKLKQCFTTNTSQQLLNIVVEGILLGLVLQPHAEPAKHSVIETMMKTTLYKNIPETYVRPPILQIMTRQDRLYSFRTDKTKNTTQRLILDLY